MCFMKWHKIIERKKKRKIEKIFEEFIKEEWKKL